MKRNIYLACMGALMALTSISANAGNIPQYKFSQHRVVQMVDKVENRVFKYLEGGTEVKSSWFGENLIFANGNEINVEGSGPGFEIGFPFVYGGKVFTHFAIDNCGVIFLGDENGITFNGMTGTIFGDYYVGGYDDTFYFGMHFPPVENELSEYQGGEIHYKTEGVAGSRKCTVEYKNIRLNGQSTKYIGLFDLQLVMHENGQIDMIFNELSSPHNKQYFNVGLRGWELTDAMLIGASALGTDAKVSDNRIIRRNDWSDKDRVIWDGEDDYDHAYLVTYTFTPDNNKTAPATAPTALKAMQQGDVFEVNCKRAANSDATIILMSEKPFTEVEMPKDGLTYGVKSTLGEYMSEIGDATVVYYDNDDNIKFNIDGFKDNQDYYFAAIACTGYPVYNTTNYASVKSMTAQGAPESFTATAAGKNQIHLNWETENSVIVAKTLDADRSILGDYAGLFGTPSANVKVGDKIEGGGEIIYVGAAAEFDYTTEDLNRIHYFAAWTMKDGVLSGAYASAHATTKPSVPYRPQLSDYPLYVIPDIFVTEISDPENLGVVNKGDEGQPELRLTCKEDKPYQFMLPEIEADDESGVWFTFEFAMETERGYSSDSEGNDTSVATPVGNEPGKFGTGSLDVICNNAVLYSIKEYKGDMTPAGDDKYISGSSTWQYEKVQIPCSSDKKYTIGLSASVPSPSIFYLRKILVENGSNGVEQISVVSNGVTAVALPGRISIASSEDANIMIYSIDGIVVANVNLHAGERREVMLPAGLYIVNGKKFVVKL